MSFFAANIGPDSEYKQEIPEGLVLTLTSATFDFREAVGMKFDQDEFIQLTIEVDEKTFPLCILRPKICENVVLNIVLEEGSSFTIRNHGRLNVCIIGFVADVQDEGEDEFPSDFEFGSDESMDEDEMPVEELPSSEEEQAPPAEPESKKGKKAKKAKETPAEEQPKAGTKRQAPESEMPKKKTAEHAGPLTFTHKGVEIVEQVTGNGALAEPGSRVEIFYVGRLTSGKVFDKTKKKTFGFTIGKREVISGMELGLHNMRVGGKRTITIPAALGYGTRGAPPTIPGNATLEFDIELVSVKRK
ncbi:hypothetical protein RCL1_005304 [Eukaryota sp. TZLM3-RCL]